MLYVCWLFLFLRVCKMTLTHALHTSHYTTIYSVKVRIHTCTKYTEHTGHEDH
jgi:hypothetical protein